MAIAAGAIHEIRSTATAGNVNGGFFIPGASGVDYSQQNAAQYGLTGVTSSGAGNTILTASAAADMVGNGINVISGTNFTTGWFEITSVSVGVSITCATNNAGASISTGVGANGVMNIGGAHSLGASNDDAVFELGTNGAIFHVKNGTYTLGATVSISAAGTSLLPITIRGYNSSRGDSPSGSTRPVIDTGANTMTLGNNWTVECGQVTGSAASVLTGGSMTKLIKSKITNTSTTAGRSAFTSGTTTLAFGAEFISYRGTAYSLGTAGSYSQNCYFHDSNIAVSIGSASVANTFVNCIITNNVTQAINTANPTGGVNVIGCTLYGSEAKIGTGVNLGASASNVALINNIIAGFTTGVAHAGTQTMGFDAGNNYYNNTADVSGWTKGADATAVNPAFASVSQVTGTAATTESGGVLRKTGAFAGANIVDSQDFIYVPSGTGVTAGKYLITAHDNDTVTTSPAIAANATADKVFTIHIGHNFRPGYAMRGAGTPGVFPAGLSTGYMDQGAVQRQEDYPAAASVLSSVASYANGGLAGTYVVAGAANVKTGVAFGASSGETGTYDGSDRWTDPGESNVKLSVAYKANSTSNNKTGTYDGSDRWTDPGEDNVLQGVEYKANSTTNNKEGTFMNPAPATVLKNVEYGPEGSPEIGTLEIVSPTMTLISV